MTVHPLGHIAFATHHPQREVQFDSLRATHHVERRVIRVAHLRLVGSVIHTCLSRPQRVVLRIGRDGLDEPTALTGPRRTETLRVVPVVVVVTIRPIGEGQVSHVGHIARRHRHAQRLRQLRKRNLQRRVVVERVGILLRHQHIAQRHVECTRHRIVGERHLCLHRFSYHRAPTRFGIGPYTSGRQQQQRHQCRQTNQLCLHHIKNTVRLKIVANLQRKQT